MSPYTRSYLQNCSRKEIQGIAKDFQLKANLASAKLVELILERNEVESHVDVEKESASCEAVPERVSVESDRSAENDTFYAGQQVQVLCGDTWEGAQIKKINKKTIKVTKKDGSEENVAKNLIRRQVKELIRLFDGGDDSEAPTEPEGPDIKPIQHSDFSDYNSEEEKIVMEEGELIESSDVASKCVVLDDFQEDDECGFDGFPEEHQAHENIRRDEVTCPSPECDTIRAIESERPCGNADFTWAVNMENCIQEMYTKRGSSFLGENPMLAAQQSQESSPTKRQPSGLWKDKMSAIGPPRPTRSQLLRDEAIQRRALEKEEASSMMRESKIAFMTNFVAEPKAVNGIKPAAKHTPMKASTPLQRPFSTKKSSTASGIKASASNQRKTPLSVPHSVGKKSDDIGITPGSIKQLPSKVKAPPDFSKMHAKQFSAQKSLTDVVRKTANLNERMDTAFEAAKTGKFQPTPFSRKSGAKTPSSRVLTTPVHAEQSQAAFESQQRENCRPSSVNIEGTKRLTSSVKFADVISEEEKLAARRDVHISRSKEKRSELAKMRRLESSPENVFAPLL